LGAAGSIISAIPGGQIPGAILATLGPIFGGLIGAGGASITSENSSKAAAMRASSIPAAVDLKFVFNQTNTLGGIADPNTQAALTKSADDAFKRFEQILSKTIVPRLNRLDRATGLAS